MKTESSAVNPYNGMFGQQGWICPKCGRVFSPFARECPYCDIEKISTNTDTVNIGKERQPNIISTETISECIEETGNIDITI